MSSCPDMDPKPLLSLFFWVLLSSSSAISIPPTTCSCTKYSEDVLHQPKQRPPNSSQLVM
jgi:hypothetical protein